MSWVHPNRRGLPAEWPKLVAQVKHRAGGKCEVCGGRGVSVDQAFLGRGDARFCSARCRVAAHRARKDSND